MDATVSQMRARLVDHLSTRAIALSISLLALPHGLAVVPRVVLPVEPPPSQSPSQSQPPPSQSRSRSRSRVEPPPPRRQIRSQFTRSRWSLVAVLCLAC